jgi:hypothetical protein
MTQLFKPVDRPKYLEIDAERGSGRIDVTFTGDHTNPDKNLATQRARALSPDELHSAGFRHGVKSTQRGSLAHDPHYQAGWGRGYALRQSVAQPQPEPELITAWGCDKLDEAIDALKFWNAHTLETDTIELKYSTDEQRYLIRVSAELLDRVLPF